jgi:hypothetical protein
MVEPTRKTSSTLPSQGAFVQGTQEVKQMTGTGLQQPMTTGYTSQPMTTTGTGYTTTGTGYTTSSTTTGTGLQQPLTTGVTRTDFRTEVIQERPVLDRVEKLVHKEIVERPHIIEEHEQDLIEVHEQPIEKRILHPTQEFHVQERNLYETSGRETAGLERDRMLEQMRTQDRAHKVSVEEMQDVHVTQHAPTVMVGKELHKEVINKPIVTEIHEQPIIEVHEQSIHKTVYEQPIFTVVREAPLIQNVQTASEPLTGITTSMHQMSLQPQPVVVQEVIREVPVVHEVVKQVPVVQPATISTTVVEKEHGMPPRVREDIPSSEFGTARKL